MADRVVFSPTFEALVRALGPALNDPGKARFKAAGVDFDARLVAAYPLETWLASMEVGAELLLPDGTREKQFFNLGHRIVASFGETMIGRALVALMRVIGPRRALERMTRNLRAANNFTETSVRSIDDHHTEVTCSPVFSPDFFRGLFTGSVEISGGLEVKVDTVSIKDGTGVFSVQWK